LGDIAKKKYGSSTRLMIVSMLLICVAAVCILMFFMQGQTTISSGHDGTEVQERLACEAHTIAYPLFDYDNSDNKSIKINAVFVDDELNSISLIYKLYYGSSEEVNKSESVNHAALNIISQSEGLGPDVFEATYSKLRDGLQLSLYASKSEINDKTLKYFMLEDLDGISYSREKIMDVYANKGLKCKAVN